MRAAGAIKTLILALLFGSGTAQLEEQHQGPRQGLIRGRDTFTQNSPLHRSGSQKLLLPESKDFSAGSASRSRFSKKRQHDKVCPSHGESQWTGTVTVSDGHDIFYWYADSRNDPDTDPILVMMAGGPGAASMLMVLHLVGPCWVTGDLAKPNPYSWNNNASVLFIDQPAGTGFSTVSKDLPLPNTEQETAKDFQQFLNIFFKEVFPDKQELPIHIATGSYGGHYGPVYLHHILESRRNGSDVAFWGDIKSLILMDAVIDWTGTFVGTYSLLCENREAVGILNETECNDIAKHLTEQKRLGAECQQAYIGDACDAAYDYGFNVIQGAYKAKGRDFRDIRKKCPPGGDSSLCLDPSVVNIETYLNKKWVKEELDIPSSFQYVNVNRELWLEFHYSGAWAAPTTRELSDVLDAYAEGDKVGDIKVLVLNGNCDLVVNTPGNIWQFDRLTWRGQDEYRSKDFQPLPDGLGATGSWKATSDGRLAFIAVDNAGHGPAGYVREGTLRIVDGWLRGDWRM